MTSWVFKTDEFGNIDYTWSPIPFDTEQGAYQELVNLRRLAKHDEFFRIEEDGKSL